MSNTRGIQMMNYTKDRARRLLQSDQNLQDCHNEDNWIEGETRRGREYLQIELRSGDKLRVYTEPKSNDYKVQYSNTKRWVKVFKGGETLQESKDKVLERYTKNIH